jgi:hypothetical protein
MRVADNSAGLVFQTTLRLRDASTSFDTQIVSLRCFDTGPHRGLILIVAKPARTPFDAFVTRLMLVSNKDAIVLLSGGALRCCLEALLRR